MVASDLVVLLGLLSATSARGDECAGACYGCRFQQSAVCVNSSWVNAGSCVTAVGGRVPIGVPPPPTPKPPPNALLPALKRGPVPDAGQFQFDQVPLEHRRAEGGRHGAVAAGEFVELLLRLYLYAAWAVKSTEAPGPRP